MGLAKAMGMQQDAQGWDFTSEFVCSECVDDDALEAILTANESDDQACSFCGRQPAATLDILLEAFVNGLRNEYRDADEEAVPWDGREGGYQAPTFDTYDVVEVFAYVLKGEGLLEAVQQAIHMRTWVEKDFTWRRRDDVLNEAWDQFCELVKYKTRYVLWLLDSDDEDAAFTGEVPPARILVEVGELIEQLGVLHALPAGSGFWRARLHKPLAQVSSANSLGTAPREAATQANRMSPAGIPMFYGASESDTAIREVVVYAEGEQRKQSRGLRCVTFWDVR